MARRSIPPASIGAAAPRAASKRRVARALLAITALTVALPVPGARADEPRQRFLSPPYADGASHGSCLDLELLGGSCAALHSADASSGELVIDLSARAPDTDLPVLPDVVVANGGARIQAVDVRAEPTEALLYAVTLDAGEIATDDGAIGIRTLSVRVGVDHDGCPSCAGATVQDLVMHETAPLTLLAVMADARGGPVPAGVVTISVEVTASIIGAVLDQTRVAFRGIVSQIEAAAPSTVRVVEPPYKAADAGRGCSGDVGTTFTCRAAAARTTGRGEFDLEVIAPVAGTVPGSGSAGGLLEYRVDGRPAAPARATVYQLMFVVHQADAYTHAPTPVIGDAHANVYAHASIEGAVCSSSCDLARTAFLVSDDGPTFLLDEPVPFVVSMTDVDAGQAPAVVSLQASGSSWLNKSPGSALARLRATLSHVRVLEIA